jgi:hypothetical protein
MRLRLILDSHKDLTRCLDLVETKTDAKFR